MKIIIVGIGKVGYAIAEQMTGENTRSPAYATPSISAMHRSCAARSGLI